MKKENHRAPQLTAILIGDDPASRTYVSNKMKVTRLIINHVNPLSVDSLRMIFFFDEKRPQKMWESVRSQKNCQKPSQRLNSWRLSRNWMIPMQSMEYLCNCRFLITSMNERISILFVNAIHPIHFRDVFSLKRTQWISKTSAICYQQSSFILVLLWVFTIRSFL